MISPRQEGLKMLGRAVLPVIGLAVVLSCQIFESEYAAERNAEMTRAAIYDASRAQYQATANALATLVEDLHIAQTEEAAFQAAPQVEAPPAAPAPQVEAPPGAQPAHPPTILAIDIASQIPADGTKVGGTIIFEDAGQDVVLLRADVLTATLHAESWTYDPRQNMVWSGARGIAAFQVWCTGDPQDVSYAFTLADAAGSVSPAWTVDYTCK